jgi:hypothetical protein
LRYVAQKLRKAEDAFSTACKMVRPFRTAELKRCCR